MMAEAITQLYVSNKFVIDLNIADLTHDESLLNPQRDGNNLNWILGHILAGRVEAHEHLGIDPVWDTNQQALYARGSAAITFETALTLYDLLAALDRSQEHLLAALAGDVTERLAQPFGEDETVGQRLLGLAWHETYHAGQTDYLRRLAGKIEGGIR